MFLSFLQVVKVKDFHLFSTVIFIAYKKNIFTRSNTKGILLSGTH